MDKTVDWIVTYKIREDKKEVVRNIIAEGTDKAEAIEVFEAGFLALTGQNVDEATIISIEPYEKKTAAM